MSDASVLLRDIAGDAASKTAAKVNPSEDQLKQIDEPAPDNQWHETPDLSKDSLKQQIQSRVPIGKKDLQDAAGDATQTAHPSGSRDPADAANLAAEEQQSGQSSGMDAKGGLKQGLSNLKDKASANANEDDKQQAREAKDRANDVKDRTREYLKEKMPQERRDQIIYRLKKMVVEIQGHSDCECSHDALLHDQGTDVRNRSTSYRHSAALGRRVYRPLQGFGPAIPRRGERCPYTIEPGAGGD